MTKERAMRGLLVVVLLVVGGCAVVGYGLDAEGPAEEAAPAGRVAVEPAPEPEPAPAPAPDTSVALAGGGDMSSDPIRLDPGDYVVEWTATGRCAYGFTLQPLDDQWPYVRLASPGDQTSGSDNVYDVEGGRWYLNVITGPAPGCPWTLTLEPR